jgi:hypothetical protein
MFVLLQSHNCSANVPKVQLDCKRTYMGPIENDVKYLFWNLQWCLLQVTNLLLNQLLCGCFTQLPVLAQEETCVRTL